MLSTVRSALIFGLLLVSMNASSVSLESDSPYGTCKGDIYRSPNSVIPSADGSGTVIVPGQYILICTPQSCSPGCAKMSVTTASGPAQICICNYMGPQPFCCTMALLDSGYPTSFGNCGGNCPAGSTCTYSLVWNPELGLPTRTAYCAQ